MRRALLLALIGFAPACAFFDDDSGDGTYLPYDQIGVAYKDAYCTYAARCGLFPDHAACASAELDSSYRLAPNIEAAIAAGKIYYNASAVKACFDAIASASCDTTDEDSRVQPLACTQFIRGNGMQGDACFADAECISGDCVGGNTSTTCQAGQCFGDTAPSVEPVAIGMTCFGEGARCVPGAYCDTQLSGTCVAFKQLGATCVSPYECGYGLWCTGTTGTRTCKALPGLNQSCATDYLCRDDGMYCDTALAAPICKKVGLPPTTCTSSSQCSIYYPCNASFGQCMKGAGLGQSCASTFRCFDAGTYCDSTTTLCTALKGDGAMCTADTQCTSNNCDTAITPAICTTPTTCY